MYKCIRRYEKAAILDCMRYEKCTVHLTTRQIVVAGSGKAIFTLVDDAQERVLYYPSSSDL